MKAIKERLLRIELPVGKSAFLWGPRRTGKTYWLKHHFSKPGDWIIDLLMTDEYADYLARPALLRERYRGQRVIIDEVQKAPALLDEVHWLIENHGATFLLTGSSARKLRRGHANLLAGRAWRFEMGPLSFFEVTGFELESALRYGLLPPIYLSEQPEKELRSYVSDYIREEIAAEAATKNLPAFSEFLRVAAITNAELLNYVNVANESGISARVVKNYFEILQDTMLGFLLPPWTRSNNRRMIRTPKFYFFDTGVSNYLARRQPVEGSREFGKSFEHYLLIEILNYRRYKSPDLDIAYWRTSTGMEVDFILGDMRAAIEAKGKKLIHEGDLKGLKALEQDHPECRRIIVCLDDQPRRLSGVEIVFWKDFLEMLYQGQLG